MAAKTFHGARAIFYVNQVQVGYATGVSGEENIEYTPIQVLGLLEVREHVPVAYTVSLSAQIFRIVGESLKQRGILPVLQDIITSGDMDASIRDRITGASVGLFTGVRCSGHTFDVTAAGVVSENVNFVAIKLQDEFEVPV